MDDINLQLHSNGLVYAESQSVAIEMSDILGSGTDGRVWRTDRPSAIKAFEREDNYVRERDCYQRLHDYNVTEIECFAIPHLIGYDDHLLVIEMGLVSPPFLLDFGKAYVDRPSPFGADILSDAKRDQEEWFGESLPIVEKAIAELKLMGIYYSDIRPGNILFKE